MNLQIPLVVGEISSPPIALLILLHAHDNLLYILVNDLIYSPSLSFSSLLCDPNSKE